MSLKSKTLTALFLTIALSLASVSYAFVVTDEGMFTPDQISELNLKKRGLKIKPIDIYNPNGISLADAIMRVNIGSGGFGTGEFVSPTGLILTNHHVGFDALVSASTPEKDYAKNGYKADSMANELPAKGYTLLLTKRVENVTTRIKSGTENLSGEEFTKAIKANIKALEDSEQAKATAGATIRVQELNDGFYYYLYETQMIKDVRVVYAPPQNIGFYGGDPDNFEWTRHTGDFTFLRAYVAADGSFAEYSPDNVPFKPKKHLTISLEGLDTNEFVFVMGYPGGTTRYRESQTVDYSQNVNFPFLSKYLQAWSNALQKASEESEEKRIHLQDQIFSLNNSVKVYEGNVVAINRADFVKQRRMEEEKFTEWVKADSARQAKYGDVLANISDISNEFYKTSARDRVLSIFPSSSSTPGFRQLYDAIAAVESGESLKNDEDGKKKREQIEAVFKDYDPLAEGEMIKFFFRQIADLPEGQRFESLENMFSSLTGKERRKAEAEFAESIAGNEDFNSSEDIFKVYGISADNLNSKYPNIVELVKALSKERTEAGSKAGKFNSEIDRLRVAYQQGMAEMKGASPYPDANASLRFTFGNVKGYSPREAVFYTPFTTLKGMLDKDTGIFPFNAPPKLRELQKSKDFGRYGVSDSVPANFLATTDIIGGNSGSPILNGEGKQVGLVFDGNYEGLGNAIFFNPNYGRTIAVDIRYVLFVTEKFGNAGWIVDEMKIEGGKKIKAAKSR